MNKITRDLLFTYLFMNNEYMQIPIFDIEVDECLMNMYFYMLCKNANEEKKEEYFEEFENSYNKLNDNQKEIVKREYLDIINAQNKGKVKKKGMINYE